MENITNTANADLELLIDRYHDAERATRELGGLDCELANLAAQQRNGNRRPWVAEKTERYGFIGEEVLEDIHAARLFANAEERELAGRLYYELVKAGQAFTIVDHSERLKSRPFEVRLSERLYSVGTGVAAHGADLRLARYATREAAERTIAATTAAELERLEAAEVDADGRRV